MFTLEKSLMSAINVGNLLRVGQTFVIIGEFTLEKGLLSAVNVGNVLLVAQAFFGGASRRSSPCLSLGLGAYKTHR